MSQMPQMIQMLNPTILNSGMNTPMKGPKNTYDENGKIRNQFANLIDEIKKVVIS